MNKFFHFTAFIWQHLASGFVALLILGSAQCFSIESDYLSQRAGQVWIEGGFYFSAASVTLRSQASLSRKIALDKAETAAISQILDHKYCSKVMIPEEMKGLRPEILWALRNLNSRVTTRIIGIEVISQKTDAHNAFILLKIPVSSIMNYPELDGEVHALFLNHSKKLEGSTSAPLLYEVVSSGNPFLAKQSLRKWLNLKAEGSILAQVIVGERMHRIPTFWWVGEDASSVPIEDLEHLRTESILGLLDASVFVNYETIENSVRILKLRGYSRFAEELKNSIPKSFGPSQEKAQSLLFRDVSSQEIRISDDFAAKGVLEVILNNRALAPLYNSKSKDDVNYKGAVIEFGKDEADLKVVQAMCIKSIVQAPTADAFNLLGRCLELNGGGSELALIAYAQAADMDEFHPYAAANLSLLADKFELHELSSIYLKLSLNNPKLSAWSRQQLIEAHLLSTQH